MAKKETEQVAKSNLLFSIPSIHSGKVHLVVGTDLLDAALRLAKHRFVEKNMDKDLGEIDGDKAHGYISFAAGGYIVRALVTKQVGVPTDQDVGVIEVNHTIALAS